MSIHLALLGALWWGAGFWSCVGAYALLQYDERVCLNRMVPLWPTNGSLLLFGLIGMGGLVTAGLAALLSLVVGGCILAEVSHKRRGKIGRWLSKRIGE
jgi:hypothetical protein